MFKKVFNFSFNKQDNKLMYKYNKLINFNSELIRNKKVLRPVNQGKIILINIPFLIQKYLAHDFYIFKFDYIYFFVKF